MLELREALFSLLPGLLKLLDGFLNCKESELHGDRSLLLL